MNKILSISAIMAVLTLPAYATIQSGATCDTTNLGQSENNSTANVEADWTANTINIDWWSGEEEGDTPYASTTCTYDGTITLPQTAPTKTGYTFAGWQLVDENYSNNNILITCSEISSQSDCNFQSTCMWANNTCLTTEEFCNTATTESDCTTTRTQLLNAHPDMIIRLCQWNLIDGNYKCTTQQGGLSLLD